MTIMTNQATIMKITITLTKIKKDKIKMLINYNSHKIEIYDREIAH